VGYLLSSYLGIESALVPSQSMDAETGLCSGMAPLIRAVLSNLIGEEDAKTIDIISNDVDIQPDGSWNIKFRHPTRSVRFSSAWFVFLYLREGTTHFCSGYGHDKSQAILPYRDLPHRPTLFFFGDGVSGMLAHRRRHQSSLLTCLFSHFFSPLRSLGAI
jgi:2-hydroxy-3-keto-5-methylthiopentenyl-1-phosphate phosphatase